MSINFSMIVVHALSCKLVSHVKSPIVLYCLKSDCVFLFYIKAKTSISNVQIRSPVLFQPFFMSKEQNILTFRLHILPFMWYTFSMTSCNYFSLVINKKPHCFYNILKENLNLKFHLEGFTCIKLTITILYSLYCVVPWWIRSGVWNGFRRTISKSTLYWCP